ncbi:MAG: hypothetical protein IJ547_04100 [Clostridia bacterium]|nr:hypothetical protein [Clostridia bacterium]
MFTIALKATLEASLIILLIIGYIHEDKVIAFERALWSRLTSSSSKKASKKHSATYYASREAKVREQNERERIALGAEYARAHAVLLSREEEPRRVA